MALNNSKNNTHLVRHLYVGIRRRLPIHLRTLEDFYYFAFSISAIFWLALLAIALGYTGHTRETWSCLICCVLLSAYLVLWWRGAPRTWVQFGYQATLTSALVYNAYFTGGMTSPVLVWMGSVQILPLFTLSKRWSYLWLSVSFACVISIYWLQIRGWIPRLHNETDAELALSAIMISALCLTQIILVSTYDSANAQTMRFIQRSNQPLRPLTQDLQQANIHKDRFLATVSHEMRTPLNAVMGYLGLLKTSDQLSAVAASYVQGAQNSAAHLLTVINDLLDFSQIQQGKLVFTPQTVNLHQLLKEAHQTLAPKAASQALHYHLNIEPTVPLWTHIDPNRVTQVLFNIFGNALKFTEKGSVDTTVTFATNDSNPDTGILQISTQDTGIGIPPNQLKKIFEPFVQLDTQHNLSVDNSLRGNGLGLAITQSLVQNLGGTISVSSQVGRGTQFNINLPIQIARPPASSAAPLDKENAVQDQSQARALKLLLVDDHAVNRLVTSATIKRDLPHVHIDEARNGTEALEKLKANTYDLVLMDLLMPDYSGIEVVQKIRTECPQPLCDVKVIALTANVAEDAIRDCKAVGILEVLPKPFERESLIRSILLHSQQ